MLNIEKYKDEILEKYNRDGNLGVVLCDFYRLRGVRDPHDYSFSNEDLLNWLISEYEEPLITDVELKYLRDLKCENNFIAVRRDFDIIELLIRLENKEFLRVWSLPCNYGIDFKGLEDQKVYTLEELGV